MAETKMNPRLKARWVAALRSGNYEQGRSVLRNGGGGYCCLGVLCDLHDRHGWQSTGDNFTYGTGASADFELPPKPLATAFGFDWEEVEVVIGGMTRTLHDHNDAGRTFAEIADAIEKQL